MRIQRVLTNNAVLVLDENHKESILCGKGIGFKKHTGDKIDESLINQRFISIDDESLLHHLEQLIDTIPYEYLCLADDIVKMIQISTQGKMNSPLVVALADHIYGVMQRKKENIVIGLGLKYEVMRFYKKEYELGMIAKEMIENRLNVTLPNDEAAYIALHIVNAQNDGFSMDGIYTITRLIQDILAIVRRFFHIEFDEESAYYYRFITHLKFFSQRILKKDVQESESNDLNFSQFYSLRK
ncbi:MAG: PRD domain-containing protein [Erysipelotrichaceae bacterium]|nr:PRD domain-containing protein [Erysipelotrichaceae bacterium]